MACPLEVDKGRFRLEVTVLTFSIEINLSFANFRGHKYTSCKSRAANSLGIRPKSSSFSVCYRSFERLERLLLYFSSGNQTIMKYHRQIGRQELIMVVNQIDRLKSVNFLQI